MKKVYIAASYTAHALADEVAQISQPKMEKQKIEMEKQMNKQIQKTTNIGAFERFEFRSYRSPSVSPTASLIGNSILALNVAACDTYRILDYAYFIAFYDRSARRIGLLFTNDKNEPGARSFGHRKNYAHLSVRLFFNFYGIDMAKRYFDISEGDGGMLVLEEVANESAEEPER